ncbi:MAG: hypothetical protein JWL77_2953 [Chthonomonadaceae bacterium]|nr:hypothetical protein [Chthonomonadaceae bacterium]
MQRIFFALVALISIMATNGKPLHAQENSLPVDPPSTPQRIDDQEGSQPPVAVSGTKEPAGAVVLNAATTTDSLAVRNRPLVIEGHVRHDVLAINSEVTIRRGATVGGHLVAIGGIVHNDAGDAVKVVEQDPELERSLNSAFLAPATIRTSVRTTAPQKRDDWLVVQFGLFVLGLLGGLILMVLAPRATQRVSEGIAFSPARSLAVGMLTALGMLVVLAFNGRLMHVSVIGLLWSPFGTVIALAAAMILGFGWLSGMRYAGDIVARRFGRPTSGGSLYGRIALSLGIFFLANVILGSMSRTLGVASLTLECVIAMMGLGAAVVTGFGKETDWLGARLRGESRWIRPHL